jgi:hypothetical protein
MRKHISPATLVASLALFFSLGGVAQAKGHHLRTFAFQSTQTERTLSLPGSGSNVFVGQVDIDGQEAAYGEQTSGGVSVYGDGVVIGIVQHGEHFVVSTVALQSARVTIRYSIS